MPTMISLKLIIKSKIIVDIMKLKISNELPKNMRCEVVDWNRKKINDHYCPNYYCKITTSIYSTHLEYGVNGVKKCTKFLYLWGTDVFDCRFFWIFVHADVDGEAIEFHEHCHVLLSADNLHL